VSPVPSPVLRVSKWQTRSRRRSPFTSSPCEPQKARLCSAARPPERQRRDVHLRRGVEQQIRQDRDGEPSVRPRVDAVRAVARLDVDRYAPVAHEARRGRRIAGDVLRPGRVLAHRPRARHEPRPRLDEVAGRHAVLEPPVPATVAVPMQVPRELERGEVQDGDAAEDAVVVVREALRDGDGLAAALRAPGEVRAPARCRSARRSGRRRRPSSSSAARSRSRRAPRSASPRASSSSAPFVGRPIAAAGTAVPARAAHDSSGVTAWALPPAASALATSSDTAASGPRVPLHI